MTLVTDDVLSSAEAPGLSDGKARVEILILRKNFKKWDNHFKGETN